MKACVTELQKRSRLSEHLYNTTICSHFLLDGLQLSTVQWLFFKVFFLDDNGKIFSRIEVAFTIVALGNPTECTLSG